MNRALKSSLRPVRNLAITPDAEQARAWIEERT